MSYSQQALELRRCRVTRRDGQRCGNFGAWGDPHGRCRAHGGFRPAFAEAHLCRCAAYRFPHRPGGGLCGWPSLPRGRCVTAQGQRSTKGKKRKNRRVKRWLRQERAARRLARVQSLSTRLDSADEGDRLRAAGELLGWVSGEWCLVSGDG